MISKAVTPEEYIASLPEERQQIIRDMRKAILKNLPKGFEEIISYGMLSYVIPHSVFPKGYHCDPRQPLPYISLASQKNHIALYHMGIYASQKTEWLQKEWKKYSAKKLDMGKSCIRFKKAEDVPVALIGKLAAIMSAQEWIALYEKNLMRQ